MTQQEEFRAYMKAANRTSGNFGDSHLSEAQMIAYCRGEVSAAEREAAEAHLVGCEECVALFRSARDFLEPARADEAEIGNAEINQAWRLLLKRVQPPASERVDGAGPNIAQRDFKRPRKKKFFSASWVPISLAASLFICFGAVSWLTWRLSEEQQTRRQSQELATQLESKQRELEERLSQLEQSGGDQLKRERDQRLAAEAKRDQLETQLAAAERTSRNILVYSKTLSSERGAKDDLELHFTAAAQAALLRLLRNKPYEFPEYAIELIDQRGEIVREISGLRPTGDDGALSILLNRAAFSAGKYKLRLFGQQGQTKKQLGEYGLAVTVR
jgi:anti-sigma factor RsiW